MPAFKNDGTDTAFDQRAGDHHDGMEWFGLDASGKPSSSFTSRGILGVNHEATTDEKLSSFFIHANGGASTLPRPASEVDKELAIHGLSFVEVQSNGKQWAYKTCIALQPPRHGLDPCRHPWPSPRQRAPGHEIQQRRDPMPRYAEQLRHRQDPLGHLGLGRRKLVRLLLARRQGRRRAAKRTSRSRRSTATAARPAPPAAMAGKAQAPQDQYVRWNNGALGASAQEDYRNEMNTFGYVVEADAYDTQAPCASAPAWDASRTKALPSAKPVAGQPIVCYMGDDARGEYIYKFVSDAKWDPKDANPSNRLAAGDKYLDKGTLFAARFKDDGSGEWLELSMKNPVIAGSSYFEFKSDADVAIFTRLAADAVGATKMDRPEWNGVHPRTGEVYFTLTNNSQRTAEATDAVNPRAYKDMKGSKEQQGQRERPYRALGRRFIHRRRRSSGTSMCSRLKPMLTSPA